MRSQPPIVAVGLPVRNGEKYVAEAIESVLAQSFQQWELVISDNASNDDTAEICRRYAAKDARIRLHQMERNVGASPNFNEVFHRARGKYFKWLAHDDLCGPEFLAMCVDALEQNPDAAVALPNLVYVDPDRRPRQRQSSPLSLLASDPAARAIQMLHLGARSADIFWSLYGVIRRSVLMQTRLLGLFNASDQVLVLELALRGKFHQVDRDLLLRREHPEAASMQKNRTAKQRAQWNYTDEKRRVVLPYWRLLHEHLMAIRRSALDAAARARCSAAVLWRFRVQWKEFVHEPLDAFADGLRRRPD